MLAHALAARGALSESRILGMRTTSGKPVDGQKVQEAFEVSPELKAALLESIEQCNRGETISAEQLFQEMLDSAAPSAKPA
jgi:hypothetical protein